MAQLKVWNPSTSQYENAVVGARGPAGAVAVTAPLTNTGTPTDAVLGINQSALPTLTSSHQSSPQQKHN